MAISSLIQHRPVTLASRRGISTVILVRFKFHVSRFHVVLDNGAVNSVSFEWAQLILDEEQPAPASSSASQRGKYYRRGDGTGGVSSESTGFFLAFFRLSSEEHQPSPRHQLHEPTGGLSCAVTDRNEPSP